MVVRQRTKRQPSAMPPDWAGPQFEMLFHSSTDGILIYGLPSKTSPGRVLQPNGAICRLLGYTGEEILEVAAIDLFAGKDRAPVDDTVPTLPEQEPRVCQTSLLAKDGRLVQAEITTREFQYRRRRMRMLIIRDTSERRRAEAALRESEQKYRDLVKHAPTGIYEVDFRTQRFTSVNDAMCQLLGYTQNPPPVC